MNSAAENWDPEDRPYLLNPAMYMSHATNGRYKVWPYLFYLSEAIRETICKPYGRLIINMPPRHGKSKLSSVYTPAWYLSLFPDRRIVLCSYAQSIAADFGGETRDAILPEWEGGPRLSKKKKGETNWKTTAGGGMVSAGAGGPIAGRGFNVGIIDDPYENFEQAQSEAYNRALRHWYETTFTLRSEPDASVILIEHRWLEDDLVGWLLERDGPEVWRHIRLPALAEEGDPLGRAEGEPLCPARYTEAAMRELCPNPVVFESMYQQRPAPRGGSIFKGWKYYDALPAKFDGVWQTWDMTFKKAPKSNSWICGQTWGKLKEDVYLIDQTRIKGNFVEGANAVIDLYNRHPECREVLIEEAANGAATLDLLQGRLSAVKPIPLDGASKPERAQAYSMFVNQGRVWLPMEKNQPWIKDFVHEHEMCPNGKTWDQIDAAGQCVLYLCRKHSTVERFRQLATR